MTASASYALVDTEVVTNASTSEQFQPGQPLLRRPRHSGNLRLGYTRGRGSLHLAMRVTGDRHDSAFLGLQRVSDGRGGRHHRQPRLHAGSPPAGSSACARS